MAACVTELTITIPFLDNLVILVISAFDNLLIALQLILPLVLEVSHPFVHFDGGFERSGALLGRSW
jgi:hypothetical protein